MNQIKIIIGSALMTCGLSGIGCLLGNFLGACFGTFLSLGIMLLFFGEN